MRRDKRSKPYFFGFPGFDCFSCGAKFLVLLVQKLFVIHDFGHRRHGFGRYFHQIKISFSCFGECFALVEYADLLAESIKDAKGRGLNLLVDAKLRLELVISSVCSRFRIQVVW